MADPSSPQAIPYQAYRSKRNSRVPSATSPTPSSRPTSLVLSSSPGALSYLSAEKEPDVFSGLVEDRQAQPPTPVIILEPAPAGVAAPQAESSDPVQPADSQEQGRELPNPQRIQPEPKLNGHTSHPPSQTFPSAEPGPSTAPPAARPAKKPSTFRHVPRNSRPSLPTSPLAPASHSRNVSLTSPPTSPPVASSEPPASHPPSRPSSMSITPPDPRTRMTSFSSMLTPSAYEEHHPTFPDIANTTSPSPSKSAFADFTSTSPRNAIAAPQPRQPETVVPPVGPPPRASSLQASPSTSPPPPMTRTTTTSLTSTSSSPRPRQSAPYRPGFQPRGVYRPRTDDFIHLRRTARDGDTGFGMQKRVERTKLERRLEKLIALHFPLPGQAAPPQSVVRPNVENRRASSLFDIDFKDIKRLSMRDTTDLWKNVLMASLGPKDEMRAAEQRLTPWEEDASVSKCPMCTASFHPLTNRKHHCRLCGKIICSLPIKRPQRPVLCSILFVVDPKTRRIEEVGEGVDYGVRKRRTSSANAAAPSKEKVAEELDEAEKFLKGVRICKDCRPVLLRQQHQQELTAVPAFARLHEAFTVLEKEILESLPQFQELLMSLNNSDDQPTKEALAARKRLLEVFSQYDALAKRIRNLPCPPGSSQERVQQAVLTRANLFLQQNMFPLQAVPKSKPKLKTVSSDPSTTKQQGIDPDSKLAIALQPLLEQEALLESYVEEAMAHRKFEDAKTLRMNLGEIRAEIERVVATMDAEAVAPRS